MKKILRDVLFSIFAGLAITGGVLLAVNLASDTLDANKSEKYCEIPLVPIMVPQEGSVVNFLEEKKKCAEFGGNFVFTDLSRTLFWEISDINHRYEMSCYKSTSYQKGSTTITENTKLFDYKLK